MPLGFVMPGMHWEALKGQQGANEWKYKMDFAGITEGGGDIVFWPRKQDILACEGGQVTHRFLYIK